MSHAYNNNGLIGNINYFPIPMYGAKADITTRVEILIPGLDTQANTVDAKLSLYIKGIPSADAGVLKVYLYAMGLSDAVSVTPTQFKNGFRINLTRGENSGGGTGLVLNPTAGSWDMWACALMLSDEMDASRITEPGVYATYYPQ